MSELAKGAEATIFLENGNAIKERAEKRYRHAKIDAHLRKTRTAAEARLLNRARRAGLNTPKIYAVEKYRIEMEYIKGEKLKDLLDRKGSEEAGELLGKLGNEMAVMHNNGIIHGDLTTSNIIRMDDALYFIDFGLGEVSNSIEKKSTDLKLLKHVIKSTHSKREKEFVHFLDGYAKKADGAKEIIARLGDIETRGRYAKRKKEQETGTGS